MPGRTLIERLWRFFDGLDFGEPDKSEKPSRCPNCGYRLGYHVVERREDGEVVERNESWHCSACGNSSFGEPDRPPAEARRRLRERQGVAKALWERFNNAR